MLQLTLMAVWEAYTKNRIAPGQQPLLGHRVLGEPLPPPWKFPPKCERGALEGLGTRLLVLDDLSQKTSLGAAESHEQRLA